MRTYAEYLTTMTVKTLTGIAKDMGLKGYSKLRKAELVNFLMERIGGWEVIAGDMNRANYPVILDVENPADHDAIVALIAEVTPIEFSAAPAESDSKAMQDNTPDAGTQERETSSLEDLKYAYRAMRKTVNTMRHSPARVRIVGRLRNLSTELRNMGIKNPALL